MNIYEEFPFQDKEEIKQNSASGQSLSNITSLKLNSDLSI
jgi:hypothetical protein